MPVTRPTSTSTLATLVDTAEHLARVASGLTLRAKAACATAEAIRSTSPLYRQEWSAWAAVLAPLRADPNHMVVLCAYCHRVQGKDGWIPLPPGVEHELKEWTDVILSHGYCDDCLETHFLDAAPRFLDAPQLTAQTSSSGPL
jgi:hypothetical protein